MARRSVLGVLAAGAAALLGGCGDGNLTPAEELDRMVEASTGDEAMWYRFAFSGEYQGKPFKIDQMVTCTRSVQSGGSLGQSPDTHVHRGYPTNAAARMSDGSQVLVRIPNMCTRHRKYRHRPNVSGVEFLDGWQSPGPHEVLPLVIWTDNTTSPEQVESYVARTYYDLPEARIKNPKGSVELWSIGKVPKNADPILRKSKALPFYPDPYVNPRRGPNSRGGGYDGNYHGAWPEFTTFNIVPIDDPLAAWDRYYEGLKKEIVPSEWERSHILSRAKPSFEDENFVMWEGDGESQIDQKTPYVSASCVLTAFLGLTNGLPLIVGPSLERTILGRDAINARTPGTEAYREGWITRVEISEQRKRDCVARLGQLRSFQIVDGRFDPSRSMPGVQVYGKWGVNPYQEVSYLDTPENAAIRKKNSTAPVLREQNLFETEGKGKLKARLIGENFSFHRHSKYVLKFKKTGQWYALFNVSGM